MTRSPTIRTRTRPPPADPALPAEPSRSPRGTLPGPSAVLRWTRQVLPGQLLLGFDAPSIAAGARAGQFVDILTGDLSESVHPPPVPDRGGRSRRLTDRRSMSTRRPDPAAGWDARNWASPFRCSGRSGVASRSIRGPITFCSSPRPRRSVGIRMLWTSALATGRRVTLLLGADRRPRSIRRRCCRQRSSMWSRPWTAPSGTRARRSSWSRRTSLGRPGIRGRFADVPRRHGEARLRPGPPPRCRAPRPEVGTPLDGRRQAAAKRLAPGERPQPVGCATATCLGCVVPGIEAPVRSCREGPVFAAHQLSWPGAESAE